MCNLLIFHRRSPSPDNLMCNLLCPRKKQQRAEWLIESHALAKWCVDKKMSSGPARGTRPRTAPPGRRRGCLPGPPTSWCPDIIHPLHVWAVPLQRGGRLQSSWMLLSQKRERRREDTGEELPLPLCLQGIQSLGPCATRGLFLFMLFTC